MPAPDEAEPLVALAPDDELPVDTPAVTSATIGQACWLHTGSERID